MIAPHDAKMWSDLDSCLRCLDWVVAASGGDGHRPGVQAVLPAAEKMHESGAANPLAGRVNLWAEIAR